MATSVWSRLDQANVSESTDSPLFQIIVATTIFVLQIVTTVIYLLTVKTLKNQLEIRGSLDEGGTVLSRRQLFAGLWRLRLTIAVDSVFQLCCLGVATFLIAGQPNIANQWMLIGIYCPLDTQMATEAARSLPKFIARSIFILVAFCQAWADPLLNTCVDGRIRQSAKATLMCRRIRDAEDTKRSRRAKMMLSLASWRTSNRV